jgi:hypothetical protein
MDTGTDAAYWDTGEESIAEERAARHTPMVKAG